jgi:hypothetical protein
VGLGPKSCLRSFYFLVCYNVMFDVDTSLFIFQDCIVTNEAEQWAGLNVTPGRKDEKSDFRSEIGGIYAMAVAIEIICKFFHISNGSMSFGSD